MSYSQSRHVTLQVEFSTLANKRVPANCRQQSANCREQFDKKSFYSVERGGGGGGGGVGKREVNEAYYGQASHVENMAIPFVSLCY